MPCRKGESGRLRRDHSATNLTLPIAGWPDSRQQDAVPGGLAPMAPCGHPLEPSSPHIQCLGSWQTTPTSFCSTARSRRTAPGRGAPMPTGNPGCPTGHGRGGPACAGRGRVGATDPVAPENPGHCAGADRRRVGATGPVAPENPGHCAGGRPACAGRGRVGATGPVAPGNPSHCAGADGGCPAAWVGLAAAGIARVQRPRLDAGLAAPTRFRHEPSSPLAKHIRSPKRTSPKRYG